MLEQHEVIELDALFFLPLRRALKRIRAMYPDTGTLSSVLQEIVFRIHGECQPSAISVHQERLKIDQDLRVEGRREESEQHEARRETITKRLRDYINYTLHTGW